MGGRLSRRGTVFSRSYAKRFPFCGGAARMEWGCVRLWVTAWRLSITGRRGRGKTRAARASFPAPFYLDDFRLEWICFEENTQLQQHMVCGKGHLRDQRPAPAVPHHLFANGMVCRVRICGAGAGRAAAAFHDRRRAA